MNLDRDKYYSLITNHPDAFAYHQIITDDNGNPVDYVFLEVNNAFEEMTSLSREKIIGKKVTEVLPAIKESEFDWIGTYGQVALSGKAVRFENLSEPLGRWYEVSASSDEHGNFIALYRDISEQKKAEKALNDSKDLYIRMFEKAPFGYQSLDEDGNFLMVNNAWLSLLGYQTDEVIGKWFGDFLAPDYVEAFRERFPLFKKKGKVHSEFPMVNKKGHQQIIEFEGVIGYKADGSFERTHCVLADITERKKAEEKIRTLNAELESRVRDRTTKLEAVNKELASFAYSISHDFRAPLRALNAFSASLTEKYGEQLDEQGLHYLKRISNAALYMSDLVDALLSLSRITRTEVKEQALDIDHLAEEILKELQEAEPERQVKVNVAPSLSAKGDIALLKAALENLIDNAWKFSSKEPQAEIEVGVTVIDGEKVFFVRDNGVGFNMAYADKLFGAFQRLHGADEFPGTGIGLATVQRIINRHGGRIWGESEVGKGATLYFTLQM